MRVARVSKLSSVCRISSVRSKTLRRLRSAAWARAWLTDSISRTRRLSRLVSSRMARRYFSCSSGGIVPSKMPSAKPEIVVIGVRSSCEMFPINSLRRFSERSSESAILLKESISIPISLEGSRIWRTRAEKSPLANLREAAAISSRGRAKNFEEKSETRMAAMKTPMATIAAIRRKAVQSPSILSGALETKTKPSSSPSSPWE